MEKTIDEIVRGSSLPLSIIIVGVGEADFTSMDVLDADDDPLYSKKFKKYMSSDIVQFVPFSEFKHDPRLLAKETLEEVPRQFLDFMERNNIVPKQVHEEQKRQIRSQLTHSKSLQSNKSERKEAPDFFKNLKEKFLNQMLEMGYEYDAIEDYLDDHGLCEMRHDLIVESMGKPNFRNPLFTPSQEENQQQQVPS